MTTIIDEQADTTADSTVAERLRKAIDESGMTQVELATRLAGPDADQNRVKSVRRLFNKWLAGTKPGRRYTLRLSEIFDKAPDYFLDQSARSPATASTETGELDNLAYEMAKKSRVSLPSKFDARFVAEHLALNFKEENILVDEIDEWRPLEFATGLATLSSDSLRLGEWYTDSSLVPGIVITELLCQTASIALLTDPVYRKRVVLFGSIDHLRIRKIVDSGTTLRVGARLLPSGLFDSGRIAQYETWARFTDKSDDLVARANVILTTR